MLQQRERGVGILGRQAQHDPLALAHLQPQGARRACTNPNVRSSGKTKVLRQFIKDTLCVKAISAPHRRGSSWLNVAHVKLHAWAKNPRPLHHRCTISGAPQLRQLTHGAAC